jgi:predicted ATPase
MELLEREHSFTELEGLLGAVAAGNGRLALIGGEAGIGKTSLVERFADAHKTKARVLWGACDALLTPRPLGPLYDIAQLRAACSRCWNRKLRALRSSPPFLTR